MLKPYNHYTDMPGYLGISRPGYLIALEGASLLFEANETVLLERFKAAGLVEEADYEQTSIGGWMGTCNFLLVNEANPVAVELAELAAAEMANYPVLDDEVYSDIEYTEAERRWNDNLDDSERRKIALEYCGSRYTKWQSVLANCGNMGELVDWLLID